MSNTEMKAGRFARWAAARRKMALVQSALAAGKTVQVSTYTKATRYTAKHAGMFKATKTGFYVQSGKNYVCLDFCNIRTF